MTESTQDHTGLKRSDRIALQILAGIAIVVAIVALGCWEESGDGDASRRPGLPLDLMTSVTRELDDPYVVWAEYSQNQLVTQGLDGWGRALLAIGIAISTLMVVTTAAASAFFLRRLAAGEPFNRRFSRLAYFVGRVLALGGIVAGAATGIGSLDHRGRTQRDDAERIRRRLHLRLDPGPRGFAVMALGFVFRAGARLQRDTEGLV